MRRRWRGLARGLTAVVVLAVAGYAAPALLARPASGHRVFAGGRRPLVLAHPGGAGLWPGDTMFAYDGPCRWAWTCWTCTPIARPTSSPGNLFPLPRSTPPVS